jgi:hypothetical protein
MECFFGSLLSIAEETLAEFLCKATGTAVDWVQMIGMKVDKLKYFNVFICGNEVVFRKCFNMYFHGYVCSLVRILLVS